MYTRFSSSYNLMRESDTWFRSFTPWKVIIKTSRHHCNNISHSEAFGFPQVLSVALENCVYGSILWFHLLHAHSIYVFFSVSALKRPPILPSFLSVISFRHLSFRRNKPSSFISVLFYLSSSLDQLSEGDQSSLLAAQRLLQIPFMMQLWLWVGWRRCRNVRFIREEDRRDSLQERMQALLGRKGRKHFWKERQNEWEGEGRLIRSDGE